MSSLPAAGALAAKLRTERRRTFVGRFEQIELFQAALQSRREPPFHLLYIHGPAGAGKSTLLSELAARAGERGCEAVRMNGSHLTPTPEGFLEALAAELGSNGGGSPVSHLWTRARQRRQVLFIDTYESMQNLDNWLRETFLPQIPEDTLTVIAGRNPLPVPWRTDAGWRKLIHVESLPNLSGEEARSLLGLRGVPPEQRDDIVRFTQGHPLALSLIADVFAQQPDFQFAPERALDVIQELVNRLIEGVPGPLHRAALHVAALARLTTEELLAAAVSEKDAHDLFEWLKNLSFSDVSHRGIFLHELARQAIDTDFRWRSPRSHEQMRRRLSDHYSGLLQSGSARHQEEVLKDYLFLHRDREAVRLFLESGPGPATRTVTVAEAAPEEHDVILSMVRQNEGDASAAIARHWLTRQPEGALLFKDGAGEVVGFMLILTVHDVHDTDLKADPGVRTVRRHLEQAVPLKPEETATFVRFWMTKGEYQSVSSTQATLFRAIVRHCLTMPNLAYTFLSCADIDFWAPLLSRSLFTRLAEADFAVDGRCFGVLGHDWRPLPPRTWLTLWAEGRRVAALSAAAVRERNRQSDAPVTLTRAELRTALREFLKEWHNPDQRDDNPLLRMNLVRQAATKTAGLDSGSGAGADSGPESGPDSGIGAGINPGTVTTAAASAALKELLLELMDGFNRSPRRQRLYRALHYTYIDPQGNQEATAEFLDLPYSTYRDHVTAGIDLMRDIIWRKEFEEGV